jgi:hypothetical protein
MSLDLRSEWDTIVTELRSEFAADGLRTFSGDQEKWSIIVIASWNVKSIKARLEIATRWLKARDSSVLPLQELKRS